MDDPLITVIIPNWNGKHFLKKCIESLLNQTLTNFRIIVVDNGSTDDSVFFLHDTFPEVHCISLPENKGFSYAVNRGIEQAETPYILLLNNDIEVPPDCFAELIDAVKKLEEFDFFALKMINYHNRDLIDGAGDGILRGGVGYRYGTMEQDSELYNRGRQVFGACAGAALYTKDFFDTVGLFDEDFFAYLEDVDLNLRANCLGLRCYYIPQACVYHIGSATTGSKINAMTISLSTKNNLNVLVKNYPISLFLRFLPVICVYQFFWLLFVCKKLKLLSYLRGILSGLLQIPVMIGKRKDTIKKSVLTVKELGELMKQSEYRVICSIMARREDEGKNNGMLQLYLKLFF